VDADQEAAALELCRRVLVTFLERHGQVWMGAGDVVRSDVCIGLAYRLKSGSELELHHLRMALVEARRDDLFRRG
jgi:hypothetical protein